MGFLTFCHLDMIPQMKEPRRKIALARHLRKTMTEPERLLWARIKDRSEGIIFKRQHALGPYVLDFFCYKAQLAVEIDGGQHDAEKDAERDAYFLKLGIETYRLPASEVYRDADAAADGVILWADARLNERK